MERKLYPLSAHFYSSNFNNERRTQASILGSIIRNSNEFKDAQLTEIHEIVKKIECGIYNETLRQAFARDIYPTWTNHIFSKIYNIVAYKITSNLDQGSMVSSNYLIGEIAKKTISLEALASMPSENLCVGRNTDLINKINSRREEKMEYNLSKLVRCPQCKQYRCIGTKRAMRSLDEAEVVTYECVDCKVRFR
jgi:DNA-directed RNA polymerase subunit M/transcription elongation factor TFIIS